MANTRQHNPGEEDDPGDTERFTRPPGMRAAPFIELLSTISEQLINMPAQRIGREIPLVLCRVVECFHLDLAAVWEIAEDRHGFRVTHSWAKDGIEKLPKIDVHEWFPYMAEKGAPRRAHTL